MNKEEKALGLAMRWKLVHREGGLSGTVEVEWRRQWVAGGAAVEEGVTSLPECHHWHGWLGNGMVLVEQVKRGTCLQAVTRRQGKERKGELLRRALHSSGM